ncbi:abortive infection family protein [Dermabacteraceae bacterium P13115]
MKYDERCNFIELLNEGGYVLNFNGEQFSQFTKEITGVDLQERYGFSKGKSLKAFLTDAPRNLSIPLLQGLMKEWDRTRRVVADDKTIELADSCWQQLNKLIASLNDGGIGEHLKNRGFTSEYLEEQRKLLWGKLSEHPTASIGIAKELIESCCVTILEQRSVSYTKADSLPRLVDKTQTALSINPRTVDCAVPASDEVKSLLGNLATVARSLAELRNSYGIGHGKSASYQGLSERHARLASGAAFTLVDYLWAIHLERPQMQGWHETLEGETR